MNFALTDEQKAIVQVARDFAKNEIQPVIEEYYSRKEFPRPIFRRMGELGLLGCAYPEEYGGVEAGFVAQALMLEEIARADAGVSSALNVQGTLVPMCLYLHGTEEQKRRYVPNLLAAELIGCFGLTEPNAGSDAAAITTRAIRADGGWQLNGAKMFITNSPVADIGIFFAKNDPALGRKGITAFLVDMRTPGITVNRLEGMFLNAISPVGEVVLDNVFVPDDHVVGSVGSGFKVATDALSFGRITVPARALGVAEAAMDRAVEYANQREAFGRKIAAFQMIQDKIAQMAADVEAARWLIYYAAWKKDQGDTARLEVSIAKLFTAEAAMRVVNHALDIFGGSGFVDPVMGRQFARARITVTGEGSSNIQKIIIAKEILGLSGGVGRLEA